MSYDVDVYSQPGLSREALVALVRDMPDLDIEDENASNGFTIVRGKRAVYCFTVDGPFAIEEEDIPEEIVPFAIGVRATYQIHAESSSAGAIPIAIRFAKKLATQTNGAVHDPQTDIIWSRRTNRAAARPAANEKPDKIDLIWYFPGHSEDLAIRYLQLARRYLPEALPRRFGEFEPFQEKLAQSGDSGFVAAAAAARLFLFWKGTYPVLGGHVSTDRLDAPVGSIQSFNLSVARPAFDDQLWRRALRNLFFEFATSGPAIFASAQILRSDVSGPTRGMNGDENVDRILKNVRGQRHWFGLPPYPVWWSFFGPAYLPLVSAHLGWAKVSNLSGGFFAELADEPLDRDTLQSTLTGGPDNYGKPATWLPPELLAQQLPFDPGSYPRPLQKAISIPALLMHQA